ncbi:ParB/RepB/Spo0J family partition protein [Brevundimonas sp.]|uniref:ParB/RepB/Spo0J family partition protein n=1 Tax=Brevundimonas sp. TaxID=1871086 RepID=UPI002898E662|nr:ParB/RepB/Spo0J family partition protein [Brevundimonas sp.]
MQLANIDIGKLSISKLNMRHDRKPPDVSDILPSVRERGVLTPLLVRPSGEGETFEIVAGRRRYFAVRAILEDGGEIEPLPCAIMEPGDDAAALEASLIENLARLDPDEVSRWETFTRLIRREGRTVEDVARTFGLTEAYVHKVMALGNLLPRIRALYAQGDIDVATVRSLTLATKLQQKDWLAMVDDPEQRAPTGERLKAWLFGGQSISTAVALFDLAAYPGQIVVNLFGEDGYFADPDQFWTAQNEAVATRRDALLDAGWGEVEVLATGERFRSWDHEATPKDKGGRVYVTVAANGEVTVNEGWLPAKEARRARAAAARAEAGETAKAVKPETTSALQQYIDLHRHAAARSVLADHPGIAFRLMVAHAIIGSTLWKVEAESQRAKSDPVTESVAGGEANSRFDARRRAVLALLGRPRDDTEVIVGRYSGETAIVELFARLVSLDDAEVMAVAAVVMGESLAAGGGVVEAVGGYLKPDMAAMWQPDDAFFGLIRDRQVANALLRDVGGKPVANGNVAAKVRTQIGIARDFLAGANNREKVEGWTPKWLAFPPGRYTGRDFSSLALWEAVARKVRRLPAPGPAPAAEAEPAPPVEVEAQAPRPQAEPVAIAA